VLEEDKATVGISMGMGLQGGKGVFVGRALSVHWTSSDEFLLLLEVAVAVHEVVVVELLHHVVLLHHSVH
jgi:hypothetical protein